MKIFLTNATGYVGNLLADALLARGDAVVALTRTEDKAADLKARGIEPVVGDLTALDALTAAAKEADGVIHTAFGHEGSYQNNIQIDRNAVAAMLKGLSGTGKPLVSTAGSGHLADTGELPVDEGFPPDPLFQPQVLRSLCERDTVLGAGQGVRTVMVRLPLYVYGRGGSVFIPLQLAAARKLGTAYYLGTGAQKVSAVHVDDAIDFYLRALDKGPAGSLFNVSGEDGITAKAIAEAVAANTGAEKVAPITVEEANSLGVLPGWISPMLVGSNQMSSAKAVALLGWAPTPGRDMLQDIRKGSYKNVGHPTDR